VKNRWFPLVSSMTARYRRSLRLGERYTLLTRLAAFDAKFWYMEQRFETKEVARERGRDARAGHLA
jgi:acyl-CoA thioesterase FadM